MRIENKNGSAYCEQIEILREPPSTPSDDNDFVFRKIQRPGIIYPDQDQGQQCVKDLARKLSVNTATICYWTQYFSISPTNTDKRQLFSGQALTKLHDIHRYSRIEGRPLAWIKDQLNRTYP